MVFQFCDTMSTKMESIDLKLVSAILATIIGVGAFLPYLWDVIKKKTKPHTYTRLIWCLTQGIAVAGMWYGNAGWGGIALTIGLFFVFIIFCFHLSLVQGTLQLQTQ